MQNNLISIIKTSNSLKILDDINSNLTKHFHTHTHILYDIRTLLGDDIINYLEIGSYIGSSASLIMRHPYKSNIYCVDPLNLNPSHYNGRMNQKDTLLYNLNINNIYNYKFVNLK